MPESWEIFQQILFEIRNHFRRTTGDDLELDGGLGTEPLVGAEELDPN